MDVRIASENDKEKWNQFVDREGGSFHLYYDWKYYYENNPKKHRFIPLLIEDPFSEICGIFPIEENLGLLYGFLTSLPLGTQNGFLIKGNLSDNEKKRVIQIFLDYIDANYSGSHSLFTIKEHFSFSEELPNPDQILIDNGYEWLDNSVTGLPCTFILKLEKPFEQKIWMGRHFSKTFRNRIRLARKNGAEIIVDDDFIYLDDFSQMYIDMVKKFELVIKEEDINLQFHIFRKKIKLFVCLLKSKPISAIMCYYTPTTVHASMGPYNSMANDYLNNALPLCAAIRDACESGYQYFDMGGTPSSSLAAYKQKFGATRIPLRIYTKKFSQWKVITNNTYDYIRRQEKSVISVLR